MKGKDKLSPKRRSWNMSRIRDKNTIPELMVRSILHRLGFRFRINRKDLPGKPDIVLPKYRTVIFVHGCYWHRHKGCKYATTPSNNRELWLRKFKDNTARDRRNLRELKRLDWNVEVIWECDIRKDPVRAVTNCLNKMSMLNEDTQYAKISNTDIVNLVREKFVSSWK
ncbi:MAG: DNA mismatch endonuclease Vsr [bacterium]|nr:DNA mismatch endonuclease Vsr [bacterium]